MVEHIKENMEFVSWDENILRSDNSVKNLSKIVAFGGAFNLYMDSKPVNICL